ncbi:hypothetical protein M413DRAFT_30231 [Hebeloma cylindrosporum]|uniref:DUF6534 domain-containing protein n=1 Tax=Hebeloma cylindrosporum TaxID=76867 RepID=A0A0C3C293_HEBCY|nr:hypothetical protein M413DRAFT_30231 [Hebeloma cylindrosporum h7]
MGFIPASFYSLVANKDRIFGFSPPCSNLEAAMQVTLDNTIGAAFLGVAMSCNLFGIAIVQTHVYYINFPKDWTFQKVSVGVLMILATLNLTFTVHAVHYYLIVNFGNPSGLETIVWSFKLQAVFNVLMIVFVQGLYVIRVWKRRSLHITFNFRYLMTEEKVGNHFSWFGPAVAALVVAGGWAVGLLLVSQLYGKTSFATLDTMSPVIYATFIAATTIDVVIASSMCYYLNQSRSSFFRTNNTILTAMRYVLITGCLTSACSLSALIAYVTMPHNMIFIGIEFLLPNPVYFNSYVAMLNSRKSMNGGERSSVEMSKTFKKRSAWILRTETADLVHSVDDKRDPDGNPSAPPRFASNFPYVNNTGQAISSKDLRMAMKVTLDNTIGAAFFGISAACILFGIAIVQTHSYYYNFPKDWMFQKVAVGVLITLATFDTIFTLHAVYYYLIVNFGNQKGLDTIVWSFRLQALLNSSFKLYTLCEYGNAQQAQQKVGNHFSRLGPIFAGLVVAGGWAIGLLLVVKLYGTTSFATVDKMSYAIYAPFIAATTIDAVIAALMCYFLNRSRSSFIRTNNKIVTVMRYVLITGFLTSACSLSALIAYATMPHNMVFIGIDFLLPNLYINSYIAMLNARKYMNEQEISSTNISGLSSIFKMRRPGATNGTDSENLRSVDHKMTRDGIPPSATKFNSIFINNHDSEQDGPSFPLGIIVHRTEEQH